jgi:hypothetical protein
MRPARILFIIILAMALGACAKIKTASRQVEVFTFASLSDSQDGAADLLRVTNQIASLSPDLVLFNGDLSNSALSTSELTNKTASFKTSGLFDRTFFIRGNHDNEASGDAAVWENWFSDHPKTLPAGVTNYSAINTSSTYLTYSFDYGNARFVGLDVPGDFGSATAAEFTWLDGRLAEAESLGLTHAFLFWHGPEYCVESIHCSTSTRTGTISTNMAKLVTIINKHPIVSATFHGHEHILGWVHMDNTRVTTLTRSYEEFLTSPSGGYLSYYGDLYPARMDYVYPNGTASTDTVFGAVTVSGNSFTVNLYHTGNTTPVWSKTFTKDAAAATATNTPGASPTASLTRTPTATFAPTTPTPATATPTLRSSTPAPSGQLRYYLADRVPANADFATLAGWGINTAVISFDVNGSATTWKAKLAAAQAAGVNVVIWPSDWTHPRTNCNWESPYPVSSGGDISRVKTLLDTATQYTAFIGIVSAQEPLISNCAMSFDEMAGIKTQINAYTASKGRSDIKIWNYIDNLYTESTLPAAQIPRIMDVAVTWQHCAGNAEGSCASALTATTGDEARAKEAGVELVWLIQTFTTSSPYTTKFSLAELESWSCQFIGAGLDGFGYYTWDANWWPDLSEWTDLRPAVDYVSKNCGKSAPLSTDTPTLTRTRTPTPTATRMATFTPKFTFTPTWTATFTPTYTPSPTSFTSTPECYKVPFADGTVITVCK